MWKNTGVGVDGMATGRHVQTDAKRLREIAAAYEDSGESSKMRAATEEAVEKCGRTLLLEWMKWRPADMFRLMQRDSGKLQRLTKAVVRVRR